MQPANAPSEPNKGQKHGPYEGTLREVVNRLQDQPFLFVIAIAILLVGLAILASVRGTPELRFIATIIAILALIVIIGYFIVKLVRVEKRQDIQQEEINRLVTAMSPSVFRHLAGIYILKEYLYRQNYEVKDGKDEDGEDAVGDLFMREIYFLKHHGLIGPPTLEFDPRLHKTNLVGIAKPTELGLICLKLRRNNILEIKDDGDKWVDPSIPDKRKNLNLYAVKALGLIVNDDGTISDS